MPTGYSLASRTILLAVVFSAIPWARPARVAGQEASALPQVVANRDTSGSTWVLPHDPELVLGTAFGGGAGQFFDVVAAARDSSGRIIVLDGGDAELRFFNHRGEYEQTIGSQGHGPGEFLRPFGMWIRGGSIHVWDPQSHRLTVFDLHDGSLENTIDLRHLPPGSRVVGVLRDGRILARHDPIPQPRSRQLEPVYSQVFLLAREGEPIRRLPEVLFGRFGRPPDSHIPHQPLFSHFAQLAAGAEGYWVGTTESPEVVYHDARGVPRRIISWPAGERRPSRADVERVRAIFESDMPRLAHTLDDRPVADAFAAHGALRVDEAGRLWVQQYHWPGDIDSASEWLVFDSDGVFSATVSLRGERFLESGPDWLLTLGRDEFNVQFVKLYSVESAPWAR